MGSITVHDGSQTCAEAHRTLVFVGHSLIDNGVNFAGTGSNSDPSGTTGGGGNFQFRGDCVMVNWDQNKVSGPGPAGSPTTCSFNPTTGKYFGPTTADIATRNAVGTCSPTFAVLGWVPDGNTGGCPSGAYTHTASASQASCNNSSGQGTSSFVTGEVGGGTEIWTSSYTWRNSLSNLRGTVTGGTGPGTGSYFFDAKIRADVDEAEALLALKPQDASAAGCLQKTVRDKTGVSLESIPGNVGLNYILVVGTATWKLEVPQVFP